jgi:hypothetical protein
MSSVITAILLIAAAIFAPRLVAARAPAFASAAAAWGLRALLGVAALVSILETSIISVPADQVGIVRKIYGFKNLPDGKLIAANGETGYQAQIIPPGTFRISPFFNVLNNIQTRPVVVIPSGFYGRVVSRDGQSLDAGQIMADGWPDADFASFLDGEYFLTHGGQKGLQFTVLKPGTYPLNLALFEVRIGYQPNGKDIVGSSDDIYDINGKRSEATPLDTSITRVPAGFVGVVRSSVQAKGVNCAVIKAKTDDDGLSAELVPPNCKGIWSTSLPPGDYYLNRDAYDVRLFDTRVQVLEFKGGFNRRYIDLKIDGRGDFIQNERRVDVAQPKDSADQAVTAKVEGWEIPQELRAVVQISPEHAPIVVAAVGGLPEVEQRIVIPSIRSHVRNVFGGTITITEKDAAGKDVATLRATRVLDTIEQRPVLEQEILNRVQVDGRRAGVDIKEIRLGESAIPPELLLARQREQLAGQLQRAYAQEKQSQLQRQETEQARATADQQKDLVTSQIDVQRAELKQKQRAAEGRAERLYLEEQAAGQTAQAQVLGKDSVLLLQQLKIVTEMLAAHPELVNNLKLPQVLVTGSGGGLEGAAAIFGSTLSRATGGK